MARRQGIMDEGLFRKAIDECAALGVRHLRLHNFGEPFVDRRLPERIAYAKARGIGEVGMISNGSLLSDETARAVVRAGLDAINISVDAAGPAAFEQTRIGLRYDRVIGNIEQLIRVRSELGSRRPKLILSFVRQSNSDEERAFIERWRQVADKVHVTDLHNWAGTLDHAGGAGFPCYRQWLTFTVLWDGRVALCCADFDGRVILGDLTASSIADIWNGDAYRRVRREHLKDGGPEICRSCDLPKKDSPTWVSKILAS
jgi:MoaA/NifB/PqqE/SkfB family radical SAM enzyme